jgi:hypothetical protein
MSLSDVMSDTGVIDSFDQIIQSLKADGLIETIDAGGGLGGLTLRASATSRDLVDPPDDPMQVLSVVELRQVEAFARELRQAVDDETLRAPGDDLEEIRSLLLTIESQLRGRPRKRLLRAALGVLGQLLIAVGGNVATKLLERLPALL